MSHTVGRDKNNEGKFEFTCWDFHGNVFSSGDNIDTSLEAQQRAQQAERNMTMAMLNPGPTMTLDEIFADLEKMDDEIAKMSDEELLAELRT